VTFVPPRSKKFVIGETSGGLGETIVRQMLASEADLLKNQGATDISPANYDFRFINEQDPDHQRCFVLELLPRRKDKNLLQGTVWIDSETYLIRRIEGEPAKSPQCGCTMCTSCWAMATSAESSDLSQGINTLVLVPLRWPVLKCPPMAGFQMSTEG